MKPRATPIRGYSFWRRYKVIDERGSYIIDMSWKTGKRGSHPVTKDWRDELRVGSVITNDGSMRIVREALYKSEGVLATVTCTIKACSWTQRAYTIITRSDLKARGFRALPVRARLEGELDKRIAANIADSDVFSLTCYDVRGIA